MAIMPKKVIVVLNNKSDFMDLIFSALSNPYRRAIIRYLGKHKEITSIRDKMKDIILLENPNLDPYNIPTIATRLREGFGMIEKINGNWRLTEIGQIAYKILISVDEHYEMYIKK